jgi:putative copper resistance protein D
VAPDLTFDLANGDIRSLKDYRSRAVVLLVFFTLPESWARLSQLRQVYPAVRDLGGEIVAVPVRESGGRSAALGDLEFPIAWNAGDDVAAAYGLFARDMSDGPVAAALPRHLELLLDRQGYIRARWLGAGAPSWADPARLLAAIAELMREPPRAPPATEHVH